MAPEKKDFKKILMIHESMPGLYFKT